MNDKEGLLSKIAKEIGVVKTSEDKIKPAEALKVASEMLKKSASHNRDLENRIAELEEKNASLKQKVNSYEELKLAEEKNNKINSIVDDMYNKELIKKSDIEDKKDELSKLSSEALDIMKNTIDLIPIEKHAQEYVSNLTFVYGDNNIKEKGTMSTAIKECLNT